MRIRIQITRGVTGGLSPMIAASFGLHVVFLLLMIFLPSILPARGATPTVYTVDLVDLPPLPEPPGTADAGPPARETESAPEPEPPPPPPKKEPEPPPRKKPDPVPMKKPPEKEPEPEPADPVPPTQPTPEPAPEPESPAGDPAPPGEGGPEGTGEPAGGKGPGAGGIPGEGIQGGFDEPSFRYNYYWKSMISIVRSQWSKPIRPGGIHGRLRAVVYFVIRRDGTIWKPTLVEWSGYDALDRSALRAVMDARRLPPLPMQYEKDSVGVRIVFELKEENSP